MNKFTNVLASNYITSMNIILPDQLDPRLMIELILVGDMIDDALYLSGSFRTPAKNMTESFARQDAERDLELTCEQIISRLKGMGLSASFEIYKEFEAANDNLSDVYISAGVGLEITITHIGETLAA